MTYLGGVNQIVQDIGTNSLVAFNTVQTTITLKDSQGNPIVGKAILLYSSGAWSTLGITDGAGQLIKEMQPCSYTLRSIVNGVTKDVVQDTGTNPIINFQF